MRKVIGFKIALRLKEIQRRAKKAKLDLAPLGLDDASLQLLLDEALKAAKPAVLFDTFSHADAEQAQLSPLPGLAYSLVLATLGEGWLKLEESKPELAALWPLVREHALEECARFAIALVEDEAKNEACELSPISAVEKPEALAAAVAKLDGAKIGVSLADGRLAPSVSTACAVSWLSKSKAKSKTAPAKK